MVLGFNLSEGRPLVFAGDFGNGERTLVALASCFELPSEVFKRFSVSVLALDVLLAEEGAVLPRETI